MVEKLSFFPTSVLSALKKLKYSSLNEIRLRADKPMRVSLSGKYFYLGEQGTTLNPNGDVFVFNARQISEIVLRATEFSIYAFDNQLSEGYITIFGGIRIGIAGEAVYDGGKIKTQKNFSSLVIRIPHEVVGCANMAFRAISHSKNKNMLVISPPGCGKTTLLRDLARQISNSGQNTLVVDERSELGACVCGVATLDVGVNTDIVANAQKDYAFKFGIRGLKPDFIVTDELMSVADIDAVRRATLSGVNVVASIHASGVEDLKNRDEFAGLIQNRIFGRYVILRDLGCYDRILDENLNILQDF